MRHGKPQYLPIEIAFSYEHGSPYQVSEITTCNKLLEQIDEYEFYLDPLIERIQLTKLSDYLTNNPISYDDDNSLKELAEKIDCCKNMKTKITVIEALVDFIHLQPNLPNYSEKKFNKLSPIQLNPEMDREEIITILNNLREKNMVADLSFYANRNLLDCHWEPFLKAATERNPVIIDHLKGLEDDKLINYIKELNDTSIYDKFRLSQPDELWNFKTGDGLEKAIALAVCWKNRYPQSHIEIKSNKNDVELSLNGNIHNFKTNDLGIKMIH